MAKKAKNPSTQRYLDINEIKENAVILKDGTLRAVILVSSINFALKAEIEQNAIVSGYMELINSFEYPVQVVVQSRKLNMDHYLSRLSVLQREQKNELLKNQMQSYSDFIRQLVEIGEIMTKKFYMVIPYSPYAAKQKNFFIKLKEAFTPGDVINISRKNFDNYKNDLYLRVNQVIGSLNSLGLNAVALDTQSLIELYYNAYNPMTAATQPLEDINKLRIETNS